MTIYPDPEWQRAEPAEVDLDADKLNKAKRHLENTVGEGRYRLVVVRHGYLVSEWYHNVERERQLRLASATKSIFSCMLAIAIKEGKLPSADAKIMDYYPEAMDVPEDAGPKPGRYVFEKDRDITFRQLISNTSGYMKPDEQPGKVFHYQTYGMNILIHALAKIYGLYDINDPEGSPGLRTLIDDRIRIPLGGSWGYYFHNFKLQPSARLNVFGYIEGAAINALDMARLGWLWLNWGRWKDRQIVPENWLREATKTAPAIKKYCPQDQWRYGYGFWTNSDGQFFPTLGHDVFLASGAGNQYIWVSPALDLVIVQSPGLLARTEAGFDDLFEMIVEACG